MSDTHYIVASHKQWHIDVFHERVSRYSGHWHLITEPEELTLQLIEKIQPRYIFFPHWSYKVADNILEAAECVCFHETDLPFGRGGSPVQNLIKLGHNETVVSALLMTNELDAGPVYLKHPLSLLGTAQAIYERSADTIADMIQLMTTQTIKPDAQKGDVTVFKRRSPEQSVIDESITDISALYDHIRMLDADTYPKAFIDLGQFRIEFDSATLVDGSLETSARIIQRDT